MKITEVTIHNFRSIKELSFNLYDYSLLVGANNSGKSNIIDAIRLFYDDYKYDKNKDYPHLDTDDNEVWIEIEFILNNDEHVSSKYKIENNKLRIRKYIQSKEFDDAGKQKPGFYAYENGIISTKLFYNLKNADSLRLGNVIFIPEVITIENETKLTGPSTLRDLLNFILNKIITNSPSFEKLNAAVRNFNSEIREECSQKYSLENLENDINEEIISWETEFQFDTIDIDPSVLVKNFFTHKILCKALEISMHPSCFGQGFQRHLIFSLIKILATYNYKSKKANNKKENDFFPELDLLIFEEPEAFLHPSQQNILWKNLKAFGNHENQQVLVTTHSPNFVSKETDDLLSLVRLNKVANKTKTFQINENDKKTLFNNNADLMNEINKISSNDDETNRERELLKYFMYLVPDRCSSFFA